MLSMKASKVRSSTKFNSEKLTPSGSSLDSDDEVVLRLNLKDFRHGRTKRRTADLRVKTGNTSSVSVASRNLLKDPGTPVLTDKRALADKAMNSKEVFDVECRSVVSVSQSVYSTATGVSKAMIGDEAAINKLILEDLWSDDSSTVEKGLKIISGILGSKVSKGHADRNREVIFRAGGHLAIVQAMRKHKDSDAVQGEGCRALGITAEEITDSGNKNAIATVGGIDAILTAMKNFRGDEQIQDFGCGALQNLSGVGENSHLLLERDGLVTILLAMRTFPNSFLIQESGCWTIVNVCQRREHKSKIEQAKCLSCVASVIDNHPTNNALKMAAQAALRSVLELIGVKKSSS
jgi:hypothetical protein